MNKESIVKFLTETFDPRVDKLFGADVPRGVQESVWTAVVVLVTYYFAG